MAQTIDINGVQIEANWATEETLKDLVKTLGGSVKLNEKARTNAKSIQTAVDKLTKNVKTDNTQKKVAVKSLQGVAKGGDAVKNKFKGLGDKTADLIVSTDKFDGSVTGASSSLLKLVGITGLAAGAIGVAAGTVETIIQNYTAALSAGFSFGDQLSELRVDVAKFGLNMAAVTELLGSAGNDIRALGDSSYDSINAFVNLTKETRDLSRNFGFFGMNAGETMQELTEHMSLIRKSGLSGNALAVETRNSFMQLNKEVLGYARLTGKQRRDLLADSAIDNSALIRGIMEDMKPAVKRTAKGVEAQLRAIGDQSGDMNKMILDRFAAEREGFFHLIDPMQIFLESQYGNVGKAMRDSISLINNTSATAEDHDQAFANFNAALIADSDKIKANQLRYQRGSPEAEQANMLLGLVEGARVAGTDVSRITEARTKALTEAEKNLMSLNDAIAQVQHSFLAQFFKIFNLDNLENGISQDQLDGVLKKMNVAGDNVATFVKWIIGVFGGIDDMNKDMVGDDLVKRIGIFIGEMFLAKILLTAVGSAAGTAIGGAIATMFAATGAGSIAAAMATGIGLIFAPATVTALVAAALTAAGLDAVFNKEQEEAGYGLIDRIALKVGSVGLDTVDTFVNGVNAALGVIIPGTSFDPRTDLDLSNSFDKAVMSDTGRRALQFGTPPGLESPSPGSVYSPITSPPTSMVPRAPSNTTGNMNNIETYLNGGTVPPRLPIGSEGTVEQMLDKLDILIGETVRSRRAIEDGQ